MGNPGASTLLAPAQNCMPRSLFFARNCGPPGENMAVPTSPPYGMVGVTFAKYGSSCPAWFGIDPSGNAGDMPLLVVIAPWASDIVIAAPGGGPLMNGAAVALLPSPVMLMVGNE